MHLLFTKLLDVQSGKLPHLCMPASALMMWWTRPP